MIPMGTKDAELLELLSEDYKRRTGKTVHRGFSEMKARQAIAEGMVQVSVSAYRCGRG
jgi:hypothetical protein